ncbi:DCC1-like thiol-disulfide oxidoreductase family protein [Ferviditalea candida]|uniref:DCC1-like thiol-disulfide oxidoreductase family protein n=1 Tax=Ferviditalea candida TaxID=3108399 RepID=A0ABU5ZHP6_9BACL|nr:DCC1-like thiol-disulfide oxidoreductase family protein [Paenibacillaceae bacterium T2]
MNRPRKLTLLYDAKCRLCTNTVEVLKGLRTGTELEMQPYQSADLRSLPPGLPLLELEAEIHVVDETGHVSKGADALMLVLVQAVRNARRGLPGGNLFGARRAGG